MGISQMNQTGLNLLKNGKPQMSDVMEKEVTHTNHHATAAKLHSLPIAHVAMVEVPFGFKSTIDQNTKEKIPARPKITLQIPHVTFPGLLDKLGQENPENPVIQNYLMRLVRDDVIAAARQQVGDETKPVNSQEELDLSKLTLDFLANQPESERRGGGIAKEVWEDFEKNYINVKVSLGKEVEKATNAAKIFVKKLQPVKTQKNILSFLRGELDTWFQGTDKEAQDEFAPIYEFLVTKVDTFLKIDDAALLSNL